jgi:SAM-dependent methyltransferase
MSTGAKLNPTGRFSNRVENYIKYRPSYPSGVIDLLQRECQLTTASVVADIGSGTGFLTSLFLKNGNPVFGVEPNKEMREAGERLLQNHPKFKSVDGTAEAATLPDESVDFITAGQAFHWFDREKARQEFVRILRPGGWVVLVWNDRNISARPFFTAYEDLLRTYGTDYEAVGHKHVDSAVVGSFFGADSFKLATFPNEQVFDCEGLKGRLLSSSYAPEPGHPKHAPMLERLKAIFDQYQVNGKVVFEYDTAVYYGRLPS